MTTTAAKQADISENLRYVAAAIKSLGFSNFSIINKCFEKYSKQGA